MPTKKEKSSPEYRILVTPHHNPDRQTQTTLFIIKTTKLFASFRYELSVSEELTERTVRLKILGLKAPRLSLPSSGHAQYHCEFENLKGEYALIVEDLDETANTFSLYISADSVKILKSPRKRFIDVVVDNKLWSTT